MVLMKTKFYISRDILATLPGYLYASVTLIFRCLQLFSAIILNVAPNFIFILLTNLGFFWYHPHKNPPLLPNTLNRKNGLTLFFLILTKYRTT